MSKAQELTVRQALMLATTNSAKEGIRVSSLKDIIGVGNRLACQDIKELRLSGDLGERLPSEERKDHVLYITKQGLERLQYYVKFHPEIKGDFGEYNIEWGEK